ncbi:Copper transporter 6 [Rhynchospora pubera]|uniref:Copper transport protein n=1 Tax=Rhynchospora pubera TaxID=906938 RepID=A0AAV8ERZ7_9POAL|nr:Copper transporter 6 [Rhynchospora pubera]
MNGMGEGDGNGMGSMTMTPPSSPMPMSTGNHGHGMMMHMTFFWGKDTLVIFSGWPGNAGIGMYLLSIFIVLIMAALAEALSAVSNRFSQSDKTASNAVTLTAIHALRMGVAYLVMLAVMSFNVGVFLAALVGHAIGFFLGRSGFFHRYRAGDLEAHTTTNK